MEGPRRIPSCGRLQSHVPHPGNSSQRNSAKALGRMLRDNATRLVLPVAAAETRGIRRTLHTKVRHELAHLPKSLTKGPHCERSDRGQRAEQGEGIIISVARDIAVREVHCPNPVSVKKRGDTAHIHPREVFCCFVDGRSRNSPTRARNKFPFIPRMGNWLWADLKWPLY